MDFNRLIPKNFMNIQKDPVSKIILKEKIVESFGSSSVRIYKVEAIKTVEY